MAAQDAIIPSGQKEESGSTTATSSEKGIPSGNYLSPPQKEEQDVSENTSVTDLDVEKLPVQAEAETPPRDIAGWKWTLVVLSILSSTFLFALDNTIVADIQPAIVLHFNDISNLTWLSVSFLLGAAATNLIWGKVFGQFNAKWTYILCVFLFELGSAVCGAAPTMDALIIGRGKYKPIPTLYAC